MYRILSQNVIFYFLFPIIIQILYKWYCTHIILSYIIRQYFTFVLYNRHSNVSDRLNVVFISSGKWTMIICHFNTTWIRRIEMVNIEEGVQCLILIRTETVHTRIKRIRKTSRKIIINYCKIRSLLVSTRTKKF